MKKSILILAMMGLFLQSYAQDVLYSATLKKGDVPMVVLKSIEANFPNYIVKNYNAVPVKYVAGNVYVDNDVDLDDVDSYQVTISSKDRELVANLDENGKLMSTVENLKDTPPPMAVSRSIAAAYPGWMVGKETFHMISYVNGKSVEHYKFLLTKDGKKKRVYTDVTGKILR
ncbi:hypothetical protein Q73A0000_16480 [Kaistella flava (ex Peng et al. 2021)]|uniref:Beta-lactamase-inhibitor-like PepSY-like domain-containing protein n=1 Tax=Kaistella flava (ex Peng et al. 2021) TaxID=2038776 RepID=A0A7M2YCI9_9FLAO|nr:hypothetical protein [Kaistella flava (ex Peng et al. 2021)]QOW11841.1 hypothetical protein Q73A0000_16480 [Kaistella flava (ex Peng et al. 2021)]